MARLFRYFWAVMTTSYSPGAGLLRRRSWQTLKFDKQAASFIRIVGTHNTANEVFHCVHFECPAQLDTEVNEGSPGLDSSDSGSASPQPRPQRPSRTHSLLPSQPSSSSSSSSQSHH